MQGHAKCEYRNGFVSGVMRLQRSPCGERSSRNHYGATKKGELKFAPTESGRIGRQAPVKRCLARNHCLNVETLERLNVREKV